MSAPTVAAPPRPLVAAAVLFVLLMVMGGVATLTAQALHSTAGRTSTIQAQTDRLTVRDDSGDVRISPSVDGAVHVRTNARYGLEPPRLVQESTATGVLLEAHCADVLAIECDVDYAIEVPPSFAVSIEAGSGDILAQGLTGGLALDLGAASATIADLTGSLDVRGGTGEVEGINLRSDTVRVLTGNGDVRLELQTPPSTVQVASGTGTVDIGVPADQVYRVAPDTATGDQMISVRTASTATRTITATSDTGDVWVRPSMLDRSGDVPRAVRVPPFPPIPPAAPRLPVPFTGDDSQGDG